MKKNHVATAAILSTCVAHTSATFAGEFGEEGFYAGFGLGRAAVDREADVPGFSTIIAPGSSVSPTSISTDEENTGWKIFGGYRFNEHFAVEGFWADLGEAEEKIAATGFDSFGAPATLSAKTTIEVEGFGVTVVGSYPFTDRFSVFGRVGTFNRNTETDVNLTASSVNGVRAFDFSDDDIGTDLILCMGASYAFNGAFAIRAEWERYLDLDLELYGVDDDDDDVDMLSASLVFSFQ